MACLLSYKGVIVCGVTNGLWMMLYYRNGAGSGKQTHQGWLFLALSAGVACALCGIKAELGQIASHASKFVSQLLRTAVPRLCHVTKKVVKLI